MGIALLVLVVGFVMMGVEAWRPGQMWPRVAGWWAGAIALNRVQGAAVFLGGKARNAWVGGDRCGGQFVGGATVWASWAAGSPPILPAGASITGGTAGATICRSCGGGSI